MMINISFNSNVNVEIKKGCLVVACLNIREKERKWSRLLNFSITLGTSAVKMRGSEKMFHRIGYKYTKNKESNT